MGKRGPEILEMHKVLIGTQFGIHKDFPDTVTLLNNFISKRVSEFTQAEETKHAWYEWMLAAASDGLLHLTYLPHLDEYGAKQKEEVAKAAKAKEKLTLKPGLKQADPSMKFSDEEMNGGADIIGVAELAKWNQARADQGGFIEDVVHGISGKLERGYKSTVQRPQRQSLRV